MKKRFVIGDIHGHVEALREVLKRPKFNYDRDQLISLGDVCDRGPDSYGVVEELFKIKNLIAVKGNHDDCFRESTTSGKNVLYNQGGRETLLSYTRATDCDGDPCKIPQTHRDFYEHQLPYYIDEENNLFIHGRFDRHHHIQDQHESVFYWDRDLFLAALSFKAMKANPHKFKMKDNFKTVFVGHTPTTYWGSTVPIKAANIWNLDTGCGKNGKLTLMDIDTEQFWQA